MENTSSNSYSYFAAFCLFIEESVYAYYIFHVMMFMISNNPLDPWPFFLFSLILPLIIGFLLTLYTYSNKKGRDEKIEKCENFINRELSNISNKKNNNNDNSNNIAPQETEEKTKSENSIKQYFDRIKTFRKKNGNWSTARLIGAALANPSIFFYSIVIGILKKLLHHPLNNQAKFFRWFWSIAILTIIISAIFHIHYTLKDCDRQIEFKDKLDKLKKQLNIIKKNAANSNISLKIPFKFSKWAWNGVQVLKESCYYTSWLIWLLIVVALPNTSKEFILPFFIFSFILALWSYHKQWNKNKKIEEEIDNKTDDLNYLVNSASSVKSNSLNVENNSCQSIQLEIITQENNNNDNNPDVTSDEDSKSEIEIQNKKK